MQPSVRSCCPAPAPAFPPALPDDFVLSTSSHVTHLFESPFPSLLSLTPAHQMCFLAGARAAALSGSGHFSSAWFLSVFFFLG